MSRSKKTTKKVEETETIESTTSTDAEGTTVTEVEAIEATLTEDDAVQSDEVVQDDPSDHDVNSPDPQTEEPNDTTEVTEPEVVPATEPPVVVKKTGLIPIVLGGALCVAAGYAGANFLKPDGWPFPGGSTVETEQRLADLEAAISKNQAAVSQNVERIESVQDAAQSAAAALSSQIDALDVKAALDPLSQDLKALEERLTSLEAAPVAQAVVSPEATAAYERQLDEMQTLLNAEISRLQEAKITAEATKEAAEKVTDMSRLQEAINSGVPFASMIGSLSIDVPEAIQSAANQGVPTLPELADAFEGAADIAIVETAKVDTEGQSWSSRFLRSQLGLRSLTPKEGNSPDAVLSRAQQAVRENDLAKALSEISALPDVGQAVMADWVARAQTRLDVTNALSAMLAQ
ncbi:hypothetical protein EDD53_2511 [Pacificibacter maritimus]|uniref:Inner membrane protein n=1 Tax=Pacificibacter maritimus TaxID=762213 RepID=A0A3N4UC56_9RHOB|nr:mitofilin family membrane protein [Pacificibacter maritimus]RPE64751.1 hypothetical protein EDD53_2511 [Pacificibacter maritimus]